MNKLMGVNWGGVQGLEKKISGGRLNLSAGGQTHTTRPQGLGCSGLKKVSVTRSHQNVVKGGVEVGGQQAVESGYGGAPTHSPQGPHGGAHSSPERRGKKI